MSALLFLLGVVNYIVQASASWGVTYPENLWAVENSCALIPCTFSYPSDVVVPGGITAIWYKDLTGQRTVVYHSADPGSVDAHFRGRAELLGDPLAHNCTLLLRKVTTQDSGKYHFRFEISEGNRWSDGRGVQLKVDSTPGAPTITAPKELHEGAPVSYSCSSPYGCPFGNISLRWLGYKEETSLVSGTVQLDTEAALRKQTLNTSFSWLDHKRVISCELSVGEQRLAAKVTVHVQHPPKGVKVLLGPSTKNLRVGDSASLTCSVNSSYPQVSAYRWFKDQAKLSGGDQAKKTIPSVARGDYGQYRCEAENAAGTGVAEAVTLFVFSAVLSVAPSSSPREGETATLTCDVPGEDRQELHYSWYKNNIWIKEGTARILMFDAVAAGDTGYYSCKVQNDKGSETSQTVALTVFYPPRLPSLTLFQDTQEGRLAIAYCTVDSNPQSTLSLYRDKRLIATTNSHMAPNQRISITTTRNSLKMEIQKVIPEDEGEYACVATNTYGNASATRFFGAKTARVVFSPSSELRESEQVTLTCASTLGTGDGITYTWYKNAKWLREGKENSLVFPAVVSGDAGSYHCVAQNKKGSSVSPAVTLRVLYPPREPVMSSFLEVQGGHLGIIRCTVDSDPPSELALYKGNTLIGSTSLPPSAADPRVNLMPSYNSLKLSIKNVTLEDEGEYMCSVKNRYGEATASMAFTANTARIVITPSSEVQEGQEVHLSCAVSTSSSSVSNYTWYKDGLHLPEAHGSSLEFLQVARCDAGNYNCRVENPRSSKSSSLATLSVLYPPGPPQVVVFMETERGRTAIFQCSVDSRPPATLVLYKGGAPVASSSSTAGALPKRVSATGSPNAMRVELRDILPEDEGSYNVTATNPYGFSSTLLFFRVQTARVVVTPSPEPLEGDAVTFTCEVLGRASGHSVFSWYKNSKLIPEARSRRLTFPQISSWDAGSYHCKAHAPDETVENVSPPVSITVFYPPRNLQVISVLQTQGRQMVTIHCRVESNPEAHLSIHKQGGAPLASGVDSSTTPHHRVSISTMANTLSMSIWDVVMEDEGEYVCLASNTYGNASASVALIAETARIWVSPSEVLEGNAVNLTCAVDSGATGELHYIWYKDSQWYAEGSSRMLSLPHVSAADAGSYYCTVKAQERLRNSSLGTLNVLYPPRKAWMKSFLETQEGLLAIIECTVDSNPLSALLLQRGQEVLADSSLPGGRASDHRRTFAASPNLLRLEIKDVGLEDEGMYECRARNNIGVTSASLDFAVETTRVEIQPGPDVREGDDVSLTCEDVSSPPQAVYTWYKNSKWLSEGFAKSLTLQNVAASDMGVYSCHIHHKKGTRKSSPATLHVHYAPKEPSLTSFLETQTGNQAVIQCSVESHPPSDITLVRGDKVVATSTRLGTLPTHRLQVHSAHNSVKVDIREVLLEDEGQYQCFANNTYGSSTASIVFSVESARVTIKPSPNVQEGATANLTCTVASRAVGEMNFTWYKNSRWLREGAEQTLLLAGVSREDSGTYHCQAAGSSGRVTSALVILSVLYAPSSPSIHAYLDNQDGKMGIIDCVVDSHPPSRLALYKGDKFVADTNGSRPAPSRRFLTLPSYNRLRLEIQDVSAEDSGRYVCQAGNQFGHVASAVEFSAETLSDLQLFKILAGIFIALACAALLGGLAFGLQRRWTRIKEECKRWREQKSRKPEPVAAEDKEEAEQLNELNAETPPPGRFCLSYQKLRARAKTPPRNEPLAQSCTSV